MDLGLSITSMVMIRMTFIDRVKGIVDGLPTGGEQYNVVLVHAAFEPCTVHDDYLSEPAKTSLQHRVEWSCILLSF